MKLVEYRELVKEAYLDPLRSVTIIDDEYPTWQHWLKGEAVSNAAEDAVNGSGSKAKWENPSKIKNRINELRTSFEALLVDIHDGSEIDDPTSLYFHHSDLVVLDYELNGTGGGVDKSASIAESLLTKNPHYNLVILHTQHGELNDPFYEVLRRFVGPCEGFEEKTVNEGDELIDGLPEDQHQQVFARQQYFEFRKIGFERFRRDFLPKKKECMHPCFWPLLTLYEEMEKKANGKWRPKDLFSFIAAKIKQVEAELKIKPIEKPVRGLSWSSNSRGWIRTSRGFITFSSKTNDETLSDVLLEALLDWCPTPSRLVSTKIRNLIEDSGVEFEDINPLSSQVGWRQYIELVNNPDDLETPLRAEMSRQMETYFDECLKGVVEFGDRIVQADSQPDTSGCTINSNFYSGDFSTDQKRNNALDCYNSFVACKRSSGQHLTTGHILEFEGEKWVVLTPACDLVPGRKKDRKYLSFTVAKLNPKSIDNFRHLATSGNFIFLPNPSTNKIEAYTIYTSDDAYKQSPSYESWLAVDDGRFTKDIDGSAHKLEIYRTNYSGDLPSYDKGEVIRHELPLRYEYALNLLSKIGSHSARIGLDFLASKKPEEDRPQPA